MNRRNLQHGHTKRDGTRVVYSPTYQSWRCMRGRCYQKGNASYWNYGARGIRVCARWHKFATFLADMGERPEGCVLDRLDTDKDYTPSNVRWAPLAGSAKKYRHRRGKAS